MKATNREIRRVVDTKAEWIRRTQDEMRSRALLRPKIDFTDGSELYYLGQLHRLRIVDGQQPDLTFDGDFLLSRPAAPSAMEVFDRWYKEQAREIIHRRLAVYSERYGFHFKSIRITSAKTRWGSCSSRATLSFNWRLVMAPLDVVDYVIVHELVHLRIPNHSREFWSSVAGILPEYKIQLTWLKKNQTRLAWDPLPSANKPGE